MPIDILLKMWYNSIKERRDVQMTTRDMVIAMLENNIESMEKDIERLEMALEDKQEKLEKYYILLYELKHSS